MENYRYLGYERSKTIPVNCDDCRGLGFCIERIVSTKPYKYELLRKYLTKEIDLECLSTSIRPCSTDPTLIAEIIVQELLQSDKSELIYILKDAKCRESITTDNIPQYGDPSIAMYLIPDLVAGNEYVGYTEFGKMLFYKEGKSNEAYRKYAENHCKLAALLDLVIIKKKKPLGCEIFSSVMGRYFSSLPIETKDKLLPKLCFRIPIVQEALISQDIQKTVDSSLSILSKTTRERRRSGIINLIEFALDA